MSEWIDYEVDPNHPDEYWFLGLWIDPDRPEEERHLALTQWDTSYCKYYTEPKYVYVNDYKLIKWMKIPDYE